MNNIFLSNYELINKIGSGSFGEVYIARHKSDNKLYAAKIEEKKDKNRLKSEYNIYNKINKDNRINGIPKVHNFIQTDDYNILMMELLGPSLENKFEDNQKKISLQCLFKLAFDMINLIEKFHRRGFIHRDIKPNNLAYSINSLNTLRIIPNNPIDKTNTTNLASKKLEHSSKYVSGLEHTKTFEFK